MRRTMRLSGYQETDEEKRKEFKEQLKHQQGSNLIYVDEAES